MNGKMDCEMLFVSLTSVIRIKAGKGRIVRDLKKSSIRQSKALSQAIRL